MINCSTDVFIKNALRSTVFPESFSIAIITIFGPKVKNMIWSISGVPRMTQTKALVIALIGFILDIEPKAMHKPRGRAINNVMPKMRAVNPSPFVNTKVMFQKFIERIPY